MISAFMPSREAEVLRVRAGLSLKWRINSAEEGASPGENELGLSQV
jgi:hypothetical protein